MLLRAPCFVMGPLGVCVAMSFPCDCVWEVQGASLLLTESIKQHFVVICVLVPPPPPDAMLGRDVRNLKPRFSQKTQILERHRFHESVDGIN